MRMDGSEPVDKWFGENEQKKNIGKMNVNRRAPADEYTFQISCQESYFLMMEMKEENEAEIKSV